MAKTQNPIMAKLKSHPPPRSKLTPTRGGGGVRRPQQSGAAAARLPKAGGYKGTKIKFGKRDVAGERRQLEGPMISQRIDHTQAMTDMIDEQMAVIDQQMQELLLGQGGLVP